MVTPSGGGAACAAEMFSFAGGLAEQRTGNISRILGLVTVLVIAVGRSGQASNRSNGASTKENSAILVPGGGGGTGAATPRMHVLSCGSDPRAGAIDRSCHESIHGMTDRSLPPQY